MKPSSPLPTTNLYDLLELPFGASAHQIQASFRRLAKIYHPDIPKTGSAEIFQTLLYSYKILLGPEREAYDLQFKKNFAKNFIKRTLTERPITLPTSRVRFTTGILELAKRGLMRKGFRNKDRRKYTGILHDLVVDVKEEEREFRLVAKIPLTVRMVCRDCMGSDLHCPSCNGKGSYKGSRIVAVEFPKMGLDSEKTYEIDLSRFRPDSLTHFKKKILRVKLLLHKNIPLRVRPSL